MCHNRFGQIFVLLAAATVWLWNSPALAVTITLNPAGITRDTALRDQSQNPMWINRRDCLYADNFHFPLVFSPDYAGQIFSVWAGLGSTDCTQIGNRTSSPPVCWQVYNYSTMTSSSTPTISISVQDIVGQHTPPGKQGSGTAQDCTPSNATDTPQAVTLYFIFTAQQGAVPVTASATWQTSFALVAPDPPLTIHAVAGIASGTGGLAVSWGSVSDTNVYGYAIFCQALTPIDASGADTSVYDGNFNDADAASVDTSVYDGNFNDADAASADTAVDGTQNDASALDGSQESAAGAAGAGGAGGSSAGAGGGQPAGAGGSVGGSVADAALETSSLGNDASASGGDDGGTSSTDDAGNETGLGECEATTLVQGQYPDPSLYCGSVVGATSISKTISSISPGSNYAVGVAAVDFVGNVGLLSPIACAIPIPADDFFTVYKRAGGRAGGGFCSTPASVGRGTGLTALGIIAFAWLASLIRRRRSR